MKRTGKAEWKGNLQQGTGTVSTASQVLNEQPYSFRSRFADGTETNPEELIAAAHAGCFSMALAAALSQAEHVPDSVETTAQVTIDSIDGTPTITRSELSTEVKVDGLDDAEFQEFANGARSGCAVSRALAGVESTLATRLA